MNETRKRKSDPIDGNRPPPEARPPRPAAKRRPLAEVEVCLSDAESCPAIEGAGGCIDCAAVREAWAEIANVQPDDETYEIDDESLHRDFDDNQDPVLDARCAAGLGGGGTHQMGGQGPIRARIFSIRRPSIRKFLIAIMCCLKSLAATCKFAADIMKIILGILTMGATIGVSSFILYYLSKAVEALSCAGYAGVSGAAADRCSCTLGAMAAGAMKGPSSAQFGMIAVGLFGIAAGVGYFKRARLLNIKEHITASRAAGAPLRKQQEETEDKEIAEWIAGGGEGWRGWFSPEGTLRAHGRSLINFLCSDVFRTNADHWLKRGIYSDIRLIIHELSMLFIIPEVRDGGLISDSTADIDSLNQIIQNSGFVFNFGNFAQESGAGAAALFKSCAIRLKTSLEEHTRGLWGEVQPVVLRIKDRDDIRVMLPSGTPSDEEVAVLALALLAGGPPPPSGGGGKRRKKSKRKPRKTIRRKSTKRKPRKSKRNLRKTNVRKKSRKLSRK